MKKKKCTEISGLKVNDICVLVPHWMAMKLVSDAGGWSWTIWVSSIVILLVDATVFFVLCWSCLCNTDLKPSVATTSLFHKFPFRKIKIWKLFDDCFFLATEKALNSANWTFTDGRTGRGRNRWKNDHNINIAKKNEGNYRGSEMWK